MKKSTAFTSGLFLDKRWPSKTKLYPVKYRVTINRKSKFYHLSKIDGINILYEFTEENWNKINESKPRGEFKKNALLLGELENSINKRLQEIEEVNFDTIDYALLNKRQKGNVFDIYDAQVKRLYDEGRPGTASSYQCSLNSLKEFVGYPNLSFKEITPSWLTKYEKYMLDNGKSLSTVGIYLRPLRALFNSTDQKVYPFKRKSGELNKYEIPSSRNVKKALSNDELKKLFEYVPDSDHRSRMLSYWFFSFLCKGMNLCDIAALKYKDINGDRFSFTRQKTARTKRKNSTKITVILHPLAKEIINRFGNKPTHPESFIFPIYNNEMDARQKKQKNSTVNSTINHSLKKIAREIEINEKISFYFARHSWATRLMNEGIPTEFISKSLGHRDVATTELYLSSFGDKKELEANDKLMNF